MNIFVTDENPKRAAQYLDDKRVVKMCTESVQILSTVLSLAGVKNTPVKPTHTGHPVVKWVGATRQNYQWLLRHTIALMKEKRLRYPENKPHSYEQHLSYFRKNAANLPSFKRTKFVNCAANKSLGIDYKNIDDVYTAYQLYLNDRWDTDKRAPTWYKIHR